MIEGTIQAVSAGDDDEIRLELATASSTATVRLDRHATAVWCGGVRVTPDALAVGQQVAVQMRRRRDQDVAGSVTVLRMMPVNSSKTMQPQPQMAEAISQGGETDEALKTSSGSRKR